MKPSLPPTITFFVPAPPKAQPRPRLGRGGRVYNPGTADGWKAAVWAFAHRPIAEALGGKRLAGPVRVVLEFQLARPADHFNKFRPGDLLVTAPSWHYVKPDTDNLAKAVLDALTPARGETERIGKIEVATNPFGAWRDDCQVAQLVISKRYAGERGEGCQITIEALPLVDRPVSADEH